MHTQVAEETRNVPDSVIEDFDFWVPIEKAGVERDAKGVEHRKIKGIASTEHKDLQGEVVKQDGIEFDYFMRHGWFNNDHKPGFENKVGYPTLAQHTNNGLYVEGVLLNNNKVADDIWNTMQSIKATPGAEAKRKIGFSVQGKVKRRIGNHILKCWVQDVAITPAPINTKTWADIVKSFAGDTWAEEESKKALTAGYAQANQTGGAALRPESLDGSAKNLTWGEKVAQGRLTKSDTTAYIQLVKGYSRRTSALIADIIFKHSAL